MTLQVVGKPMLHGVNLQDIDLQGVDLQDVPTSLKLERRSAAVLTYLTLEGPTSRSKLAGLLWPDVEERRARNNLVQALRRLKQGANTDLITGDDTLKLSEGIQVDIATLNILAFQSKYQELLEFTGELLPYDYDDLPEFGDWLLLEREKLSNLRREALKSLILQHEKETNFAAALTYAQTLLQLDVIDEASYRLIMRLHYVAGNRAEAMKVFERCKTVLQKELDVEPSLETHKLAADINFGSLELNSVKPKETTLPLSILRPPVLVGREKEWERLEAAWHEGKVIFIHGEPGSGKSRLMLDFVTSKGDYSLVDPRPGDEAVIYSTHARNVRRFLEKFPKEKLEPWVHTEISRLVPELSPESPPPMQSETDKLRLFEAVTWLTLRHHALGAKAIVMDDMQFIDAGSSEIGNFLIGKHAPISTPEGLRSVNAYRTGEISAQMEATIQNLVNAGTAVLIEVKPLDQHEVGELVESLAIPHFRDLTERLSNYTGGNPFFILETLKSLLESGSDDPSHFPVSSRVSALIHNRLNKLHPTSLKLARVAAVAGTDFTLQLAETILNMDALELAEPFAELERLHVLRGNTFAHDLIYEATLSSLPAPIKTLLHGRIATWLEATNANPARIAQHYLDAGEAAKAAPQLLHAAEAARDSFRFNEAVKFYEKVATILESLGRSDEALKTWQASAKILIERIRGLDMKVDTDKLLRLAKSLDDKAFAWWIRGALLTIQSRFREAELALRSGIAELREGSDNRIASQLFAALSESLMSQGKLDEASQASLEAYERCRKLGPSEELIGALANVAVILDFQDRMSEAAKFYQRAEALAEQLGHTAWRVTILNDYGFSLREDGLSRASLEPLFQAREFLKELYGVPDDLCRNNAQIAESYHQLCEYQKALSYIEEAIHLSQHHSLNYGYIEVALARTLGTLGQLERAYELCQTILDRGGLRKTTQGVLHRVQAQLTYDSPARAFELIEKAINYLEPKAESTGFVKTQLIKLASLPLRKRLSIAKDLQYIVHKKSFYAYIGPAETRLAQTLLELGNPQEAEKHVLAALETLETYEALDFLPAETMFTYYRILKSLGNSNARRQLEQTLTWLMEVADNKVPPEYRESFLTRNPVNKAILDEAKKVGISLPAL